MGTTSQKARNGLPKTESREKKSSKAETRLNTTTQPKRAGKAKSLMLNPKFTRSKIRVFYYE